jgi:hypothetical protein
VHSPPRNVASAANDISFVQVLDAEGYAPARIHAIVHAIAARSLTIGVRPPGGGLYDLAALARRTAPIADDEPAPPLDSTPSAG